MSSVVEGVCTVNIDTVSALVMQNKANTELLKAKSYERMYYATYGPFKVGEYKYDVRVSPISDCLFIYLCFLENAAGFKKCGYIAMMQDHNANEWTVRFSTRLNKEEDFRSGTYPYIRRAPGLPTIYAARVYSSEMRRYSKDDCFVVKFTIWVFRDDSKVGPRKPPLQLDKKLSQPNVRPPGFVSKLLAGQFADVHFIVKGEVFAAHKAILAARSPVFHSELLALHDDTCGNKLCISVQHMDALTFKHLLHFIYADSLPSDFGDTNPVERYHLMFIAAHRFEIERLKLICEEKLTKTVTDTIAITLKLNECGQEPGLLKIVAKDCNIKPEISTATTSRSKVRDCLLGAPVTA